MSEHDDPEDLAGEYVLGVLGTDEMAQCAARRRVDPEFDRLVSGWERRLMPASSILSDVTPPRDLRDRIEAQLEPSPPAQVWRLRRQLWVWRTLTAACVRLAAAGLAAVVWTRPVPPAGEATAMLAPGQGGFVVQVVGQAVRLDPVKLPAFPAGRDLELWSLPAGANASRSLGVLPPSGRVLPPGSVPAGDVELLVSLEPAGGPPSGAPTGPVLFQATLRGVK